MADRKSFWAWCLKSEEPSDADRAAPAAKLSKRYGTEINAKPVPSLGDAELRAPRIGVPDSVAGWCSTTTYDRARYAYGAHFTERVRAFNLDFPCGPSRSASTPTASSTPECSSTPEPRHHDRPAARSRWEASLHWPP